MATHTWVSEPNGIRESPLSPPAENEEKENPQNYK